ncbi:MAG: replicative DNA helicase [Acidobacteria bacterium]|nr:replicative DNA helicase [Acidobacteriota bacterium]
MASVFPDRREQYLEKPLPSSEDSERVILGAILLDNALIAPAVEHLKPEDFYSPLNRRVFGAMIVLFEKQRQIDPILIGEELKKEGSFDSIGGTTTITNLTFGLPHFSNIDEYIQVVKDKSVLRNLIRSCNTITSEALAEEDEAQNVLINAEKLIFAIAEGRQKEGFARIAPIAENIFEKVKARAKSEASGLTGLTTGFRDLDQLTSGLQRTDLVIVAARPAMGKTSLCLNIAQNAATRANAVVALFSLEMSKEQLVTRLLASEAGIDAHRFRTGHLMHGEWERLAQGIATMANTKIFLDDTPAISALEVRAKCRRLAAEQKSLDLVVIDYLQLMGSNRRAESRQVEVSQISRELKALAKELDVPVVALSQLSRAPEARNPPRPVMSDLRESGSIEQDADVVAFIYRPEYYSKNLDDMAEEDHSLAEIIVAKHRNGPTDTIKLAFLKQYTKFVDAYRE